MKIQPTYTQLAKQREEAKRVLDTFTKDNYNIIAAYLSMVENYQSLTTKANRAYLEEYRKTEPL